MLNFGGSLPERPGDEAPAGNTPVIEQIIHAVVQDHRAEPFEENHPHRDMESDFPPAGRFVVRAKLDPPVDEEINRQCHRHGQGVVEMTVKERGIVMQIRFDQRAIDKINREADQKNGVAPVTKPACFLNRHRE